jgi:hypothetical protein
VLQIKKKKKRLETGKYFDHFGLNLTAKCCRNCLLEYWKGTGGRFKGSLGGFVSRRVSLWLFGGEGAAGRVWLCVKGDADAALWTRRCGPGAVDREGRGDGEHLARLGGSLWIYPDPASNPICGVSGEAEQPFKLSSLH